MPKNILIVTGSPRVDGNSDLMAQAFARGAKEAGHTVVTFAAGRSNIKPCIACRTCYSKGIPCSFGDDFNKLAPLMEQADVIVLVSPVYWYDVTAQLKAAIDKLYVFSVSGRRPKIRESVLMLCGGVKEPERFDGAVQVYRRITQGSMQWKDRGVILATGCSQKGDVLNTPAIEQAYQLGRAI